ncbi:MAG: hypothetical protein Q8L15_14745 [Methylobacter sp.]|nr:hypothetical protein [Methylobacter sp.]
MSWNREKSFITLQLGVLIKNAEALEIMEKIDTLVVDKTGTLNALRLRRLSL